MKDKDLVHPSLETTLLVLDLKQNRFVGEQLHHSQNPAALRKFLFPILIGLLKSKALQVYPKISVEYFTNHFKSIEESFPVDEVEIEKLVCCSWMLLLGIDYIERNKRKRSTIADFWKCFSLGSEVDPKKGQLFIVVEESGSFYYLPFFHNKLGYTQQDYEVDGSWFQIGIDLGADFKSAKQSGLHWSLDKELLEKGKGSLLLAKIPTPLDTLYQRYFYDIWIFVQTRGSIFPANLWDAVSTGCLDMKHLLNFQKVVAPNYEGDKKDSTSIIQFMTLIGILLYPVPTEYLTDYSKYFIVEGKRSLPPYSEV